jgi:hypothetical protein
VPEKTEDERQHWQVGDRPELDPVRVAKAVDLNVVRMDDDHFKVYSSRNEYFVALRPYYDCGCGDFVWRNEVCKHLIAALLWDGDEEARGLANELIVE